MSFTPPTKPDTRLRVPICLVKLVIQEVHPVNESRSPLAIIWFRRSSSDLEEKVCFSCSTNLSSRFSIFHSSGKEEAEDEIL